MKEIKIISMATVLICLMICLSEAGIQTVYAVEGWTNDSGEWMYLDEKNQPVSNRWKQSKEDWYYLDHDGTIIRESFIESRNGLYYVDREGKRVQSNWVLVENQVPSQYEDGWYYFGADGKAYHKTVNFKKRINNNTYAFDENGKMLTGWLDDMGNPLAEYDNPITEGIYYAGEDGALWAEAWLAYNDMDRNERENLESAITGRDYSDYEEIWMYFDSSFKRVKSSGDRLKQKDIGGKTYGFDENGIMLPWWSKVASVSNANRSNPTSSEPAKFCAGYNGGSLLKNAWFWMYPSGNLDEKDYKDEEYSWWRTNEKGEVYQNRIREVKGRTYAFDGLGRMRTGFILFDGRSNFVAQYDTGDWSSENFKNGDLYGLEKADLYLFAPDELNDGSMQKGNELKVELEDGVYTFGFGSRGIAYGNRNKLRRVENSFYINGLKLEPDRQYGYGVVKDGEKSYRVVNANGKMVSGKKRLVRDKEGGWLIILNSRFVSRVEGRSRPIWRSGEDGIGYYHYDRENRDDQYAGGIIAGYDSPPNTYSLPEEEKLNFK